MKQGVEHPNCIRLRRIKAEREREALRDFIYTTVAFLPIPDSKVSIPEKNWVNNFTHSCRIICLGRMRVDQNKRNLTLGLMDYYSIRVRTGMRAWNSDTPTNSLDWAKDIIDGLRQNHEVKL